MLYSVYLPILLQQLDERRISVRYKCICRDVNVNINVAIERTNIHVLFT